MIHISTSFALLVVAIIILVCIAGSRLSGRLGVPTLFIFIMLGMLFGSDGIFKIPFGNFALAEQVCSVALIFIMFYGGFGTRWSEAKPVAGRSILLSSVGVVLTALLTGLFCHLVLNMALMEGMLLGAVLGSTDAASVFSILRSRKLNLKYGTASMLELESGSNDPMANILTILFIQVIQVGHMSFGHSAGVLLMQIGVGAVAGYVLGRISLFFVNRLDVDNQSQYPILLLALVFFIFSFTDLIGGNGYLAVYLAGLVIGNSKMPHHRSTTTFFDGIAWLAQLVMFLTLGLLVNPTELLPVAGIGLLIAVAMILIARPATVYLCLLPFRKISGRAKAYVSWVGLRGAVPIIFATYPLIAGINNANLIFNIVFFITIMSLVIQGTTVGYMAGKLRMVDDSEPAALSFSFEELPDEIKSTLSETEVTADMLASGDRLMDLPLPDDELVVTVKRDGAFFIPNGRSKLCLGDKLLVISHSERGQILQTK